ncbi:hypothetical protein GN277_22375 [Lachnospiraceae bacterium WCA-9-b2]|uniref:Anti-sigma factor RsgI-like middle domain-containing protein n=1 Tax=Sporofaciens musculi TaxID=2681861 RepID=A0A7X3SKU6_9FIRM|nr:hypothetical protein [Sporofaciens musculi]MCI9422332.1 hypothetical protein [Dorea sp.]MXP77998.1 hypothetical protein [Sporofaciens musculi]
MSDRRLKEAFDNVHADDELKRRTREFLVQKTQGYKRGASFPYWRMAAVMACFLLSFIMVGFGGYFLYFIPVSSISVDVNPSIELGINRFDKVVTVDTFNNDGYHIMSSLNVRFMDYRDAMDMILSQESEEAYLAEDSCIAITVSGAEEGKQREMLAHLHTCASSYGNVHCSSGSHGEALEAHEAGMTLGRYQAFMKLQALDPSVTQEDIEGLTISQIWDKIAELSGNREDDLQNRENTQDDGGVQNGCDAGAQNGDAVQNDGGAQNEGQGTCQQNRHHGGNGHGHGHGH